MAITSWGTAPHPPPRAAVNALSILARPVHMCQMPYGHRDIASCFDTILTYLIGFNTVTAKLNMMV